MFTNLYGEQMYEADDVLLPLIKKSHPLYHIIPDYDSKMGFVLYETERRIDGTYVDLFHKSNKRISNCRNDVGGICSLYVIYKLEPGKKPRTIYCGQTTQNISVRVGRFISQVRGTNRSDEAHPAAKQYKDEGGNLDYLYLQYNHIYLTKELQGFIAGLRRFTCAEDMKLDERLAYHLKSEYNTRKKAIAV